MFIRNLFTPTTKKQIGWLRLLNSSWFLKKKRWSRRVTLQGKNDQLCHFRKRSAANQRNKRVTVTEMWKLPVQQFMACFLPKPRNLIYLESFFWQLCCAEVIVWLVKTFSRYVNRKTESEEHYTSLIVYFLLHISSI